MTKSSARRPAIATRAAVLLACACAGAACDRPPVARADARPSAPIVWRQLGAWAGRGNSQTGSFDVTTGSLRLTWAATPAASSAAGHLTVSLHSAISGRVLQTLVDHDGGGSATVHVADEPRTSYLAVESSGLAWRLTLDEAGPGSTGR